MNTLIRAAQQTVIGRLLIVVWRGEIVEFDVFSHNSGGSDDSKIDDGEDDEIEGEGEEVEIIEFSGIFHHSSSVVIVHCIDLVNVFFFFFSFLLFMGGDGTGDGELNCG